MPEPEPHTSPAGKQLDRRLLLSLALSPLAAGISTIVGFIVAHWITIVAYKRTGYVVSASCFVLCAVAAWLAASVRSRIAPPDDSLPHDSRREFMARLALLLAGLCALLVLAGTFVLLILRPSD